MPISAKGNLDAALGRLRPGAQDQSELRSRLCRPRAAFREAPRPRRRACRLSRGGQRRAGATSTTSKPRWRAAVARERLEALLAGPAAPCIAGKASPSTPPAGGAAQGRADRRQRRLQERRAAGQSAARRQADRVDLSRARLCHGDAGARSHPGQILCRPARIRPRGRKGGLGGGLLCRPRHGNRRRELSDPGRRQAGGRQRRGDAGGGAGAGDRVRRRRAQAAAGDARRLPRQSRSKRPCSGPLR